MKTLFNIVVLCLFIFSFGKTISAQSRTELENGSNRQLEKSYSILLPVLNTFYHDFPEVNEVASATYIAQADVYHISYNNGGTSEDVFYANLNDANEYTQVASGFYSNWDKLPSCVRAKFTNTFDQASLKEFYILEKDGANHYYALRADGDNRMLVEYNGNGKVTSRMIYNVAEEARKAAKREGRYYRYYKVSYGYNTSGKHLSDYLF